MNAPTINVPERNRAVKALLVRTYGVGVSVKAGRGTAYHWIDVEFFRMPDELRSLDGIKRDDAITNLIRANGIHVGTFNSDGDYTGDCIEVKFPREDR